MEINNIATTYEQLFSTYVADASEYATFLSQHAGEPIVAASMREVVKREFRRPLRREEAIAAVDRALKATRELQALYSFMRHCRISEADGLRIIVSTVYGPIQVACAFECCSCFVRRVPEEVFGAFPERASVLLQSAGGKPVARPIPAVRASGECLHIEAGAALSPACCRCWIDSLMLRCAVVV